MIDVSNPRRIDPAAVAAWFAAHPGVDPIYHRFVASRRDDSGCAVLSGCCGLISQLPQPASVLSVGARAVLEYIVAALGLDWSYARGFVGGWDGRPETSGPAHRAVYEIGHADGRAAAAATKEAIRR